MAESNLPDHEMDIDRSPSRSNSPENSRKQRNPQDGGKEAHSADGAVAIRSVEGWVVIGTNIHEEADEEAITDFFAEFGEVKNVQLPLDRRTGFAKGYVLVQYGTLEEATRAVEEGNGGDLLEEKVTVDYAIVRAPPSGKASGGRARDSRRGGGGRQRSRSPGARQGVDDAAED